MDEDEESMILWELCPEPAFLIFPYIFFNAFSDFSLDVSLSVFFRYLFHIFLTSFSHLSQISFSSVFF
jgi:hypothetical protein